MNKVSDTVFLSGTSNQPLAQKIVEALSSGLGSVDITRFIDNECRVHITEKITQQPVYVIQSLSQIADQHLVELCLIGQALKNLTNQKVTAVIPWLGYSKQDKEFRPGEAVSAQLVAKFIQAAGFDEVITLELHSEKLVPYFTIPVIELSTHKLLASALGDTKNMLVVSPDAGGQSRSKRFADENNLPIVYLEKKRDLATGEVKMVGISDSVSGRDVIIFDDIINTGSTAIHAGEFLKEQGCSSITFLATHAVLAGDASVKLATSIIDRVIVTDTIFIPEEKQFNKLQIFSVASLIADYIKSSSDNRLA